MPKVPFLIGPTASGKTSLSISIALKFDAEIISADSRQIYKDMSIGTAHPTSGELATVPHHFIASLKPDQYFSAGEYGWRAREKIAQLHDKGKIPFVVGGSGLYISTLVDDFFIGPSADSEIRLNLKSLADEKGVHHLHEKLLEVDPASAEKIMASDYRRIERALEIFYLTGIPISKLQRSEANAPPFTPVMVGLRWNRQHLYERINQRCIDMLQAGLIAEVQQLLHKLNPDESSDTTKFNALNSVGYVEVIRFLKNEIDYDEMVRLFQRNSRRFAKRQISWFGRDERIHWVELDGNKSNQSVSEIISDIYHQEGINSIED